MILHVEEEQVSHYDEANLGNRLKEKLSFFFGKEVGTEFKVDKILWSTKVKKIRMQTQKLKLFRVLALISFDHKIISERKIY